jgi:uncharacterized membrane protein YgcG
VVAALSLVLATAASALADTVHVYDNAHVLDASRVQSDAASLPDPMDIYTTNTFNGSASALEQRAITHITDPRLIVMVTDTVNRHLAIVGGKSVPLSTSQYNSAGQAFANNFNGGDYTGATIAAINSLKSSLAMAGVVSGAV